jgi:tetratricopeptide (TPR) repeat protein
MRARRLISLAWPRTWVYLLLTALLLATGAHSFEARAEEFAESLLIKAADSYKLGAFNAAARQYEEAIELGANSGHVRYNLGNTYFRLGRFGKAIVQYRIALKDLPRDPDIRANLELARKKAVDKIENGSDIDQALGLRWLLWPRNQFNSFELIMVGMIAYIAFWFCIISLGMKRTPLLTTATWVLGIATLCIGLNLFGARIGRNGDAVFALSLDAHQHRPAVITASEVDVYSGNAEHFQVIFKLHEGTEVDSPEVRGKWVSILLPSGQRGWVRESQITLL